MKKILFFLLAASLAIMPVAAGAIDFSPPGGGISDVPTLVNRILTPVWQVFIGLAVIMIIIAGVLFLVAAGNPEKIAQARMALLWGIVGIAVGVLAFSITAIVKMTVGG